MRSRPFGVAAGLWAGLLLILAACANGERVVAVPPAKAEHLSGLVPLTQEQIRPLDSPFMVTMIVDEASPTGYEIPETLERADELLRIALGNVFYRKFIQEFRMFYCFPTNENNIDEDWKFTYFASFIAVAWGLDREESKALSIPVSKIYFFEETRIYQRIYAIFASIQLGQNNLDKFWFCTPRCFSDPENCDREEFLSGRG